jgi:hypothetical protein
MVKYDKKYIVTGGHINLIKISIREGKVELIEWFKVKYQRR